MPRFFGGFNVYAHDGVLGKAKTTKVGMVWYEFNIVNE